MSRHISSIRGIAHGQQRDTRIPIAPSLRGLAALGSSADRAKHGHERPDRCAGIRARSPRVDAAAEDLWRHRGESLVVSGPTSRHQMLVHATNALLGNNRETSISTIFAAETG